MLLEQGQGNMWIRKAVILLALASSPAHAIICISPTQESRQIRETFSRSDHVFSARVEEIFHGPMFGRENVRMARLRVTRVWKGNLELGEIVTTSADGSTTLIGAGLEPPIDAEILVYVSGEQPFVLSACGRTGFLEHRARDLRMFRKLSPDAG